MDSRPPKSRLPEAAKKKREEAAALRAATKDKTMWDDDDFGLKELMDDAADDAEEAAKVLEQAAAPDISYTPKWQSALAVGNFRLADVNSDGKPDLLGFNDSGASIYLALGQGDGTFATPLMMNMTGVTSPLFEVADLACDGNQDLVIAAGKNLGYLQLRTDGAAISVVPITTSPSLITGLAVKDLNNDGRPEIVFTTATSGLMVLSNSGP